MPIEFLTPKHYTWIERLDRRVGGDSVEDKNTLESVWEMWTSGRRAEIPALVEGDGDSTEILKKYLALQGDLYWEKRNLEAVLAVSAFGRTYAASIPQREAENVLLYNTASFTLPWWSDSLPTTPWQRRLGYEAARMLISLRKNLNKGPADFSKAYWVLGAHHLYRGNLEDAIDTFNEALVTAREVREKNLEACALEGLGRTRIRLSPRDRKWGYESLGEARSLYSEVGDTFNLAELEKFLGKPPQ
jgi:tetratricopeptide (TPR) repeat protein